MISDHMERYQEENNLRYEVLRSIVVDEHESAWMRYRGEVKYDITGRGGEGRPFEGYTFDCECYFTEGVGWEVKDGERYSLRGQDGCVRREAALYLRRLELRAEYLERYDSRRTGIGMGKRLSDGNYVLAKNVGEIIGDLIHRRQRGEFIGDSGGGAGFWGGYFYLQTVADIVDSNMGRMYEVAAELVQEKKIGLEGAVVQPYREPPPPTWTESFRVEKDDWTGIASLPGNRAMKGEWKLEVLRPDGEPGYTFIPRVALLHDPVFGPDVEDVRRAERRLVELITTAQTDGDVKVGGK